jgi:hypothetical protein
MRLTVFRVSGAYTVLADEALVLVDARPTELADAGESAGGLAGRAVGALADSVLEARRDRSLGKRSALAPFARLRDVVRCRVADLPTRLRDHADFPRVARSRGVTVIARALVESAKLSVVFGLQLQLLRPRRGERRALGRRIRIPVRILQLSRVGEHLRAAGYPVPASGKRS